MAAGNYDLTIDQGATFNLGVEVFMSNGSAMSLVGYTGRAQLRQEASASNHVDFVVAINGPAGTLTMSLTKDQTAALACGPHKTHPLSVYYYDLEVVAFNGEVTRLLYGKAYVNPEMTR